MDARVAKAMSGSALNPIEIIEIVDVEPVVVQSPSLPILPTVASTLETNIEETAATVTSAPVAVETQDGGSTFLEEVDVNDAKDDGGDNIASPSAPVVVDTQDERSTFFEEVDTKDAKDDGGDNLAAPSSVVSQPVEPSALQDEEIEDDSPLELATDPPKEETPEEALLDECLGRSVHDEEIEEDSPLALATEPPEEKTPEEALLNEDLAPSAEGKAKDEEEPTTIPYSLPQSTTEPNASREETTEETIQEETVQETTTMGATEGGPESNYEEPTRTNTSSILMQSIKSNESPGEDLDTTLIETDDEEDLDDQLENSHQKSEDDAVTCKSGNVDSAIPSVARSFGDQKNGYDSHTSNESPEPGGSVSASAALCFPVSTDGKVPIDPNLIEEGRTGRVLNETKARIPKENFWGKRKVKYGLGCFLLVVIGAVVGVVVALSGGSGGEASQTKSPTAISLAPSPSPSAASSAYDLRKFLALLPNYSQVALLDEVSSQAKAFDWLERDSDLALYSDFQRLQRFALATLFYATDGEQWSDNGGWVESFPFDECDWFMGEPRFIEECVNGRHEELTLDLNGLVGTLPNELAILTDLKILRLSFNGLKGGIPSSYGLLTNLKILSLYLNRLDGQIPSDFGRLTALEDIDLTRNSLTGPIPSEVLTGWNKVKVLGIGGNSFSGAIPSEVGGLTNAEYIDLSDNSLEGQIPTEFALLPNLETLYLHNNAGISGQIPSVLGSLSQLQIITFDNTNISGTVPRELCALMQSNFLVIEVDCSRVSCNCGCTCV